jgi:hypothetical protein
MKRKIADLEGSSSTSMSFEYFTEQLREHNKSVAYWLSRKKDPHKFKEVARINTTVGACLALDEEHIAINHLNGVEFHNIKTNDKYTFTIREHDCSCIQHLFKFRKNQIIIGASDNLEAHRLKKLVVDYRDGKFVEEIQDSFSLYRWGRFHSFKDIIISVEHTITAGRTPVVLLAKKNYPIIKEYNTNMGLISSTFLVDEKIIGCADEGLLILDLVTNEKKSTNIPVASDAVLFEPNKLLMQNGTFAHIVDMSSETVLEQKTIPYIVKVALGGGYSAAIASPPPTYSFFTQRACGDCVIFDKDFNEVQRIKGNFNGVHVDAKYKRMFLSANEEFGQGNVIRVFDLSTRETMQDRLFNMLNWKTDVLFQFIN